jgi:hypothetical protein
MNTIATPVAAAGLAFVLMLVLLALSMAIVAVKNSMRMVPEKHTASDYAKAGAAGVLFSAVMCVVLGVGLTLFGSLAARGFGQVLTAVSGAVTFSLVAFALWHKYRR